MEGYLMLAAAMLIRVLPLLFVVTIVAGLIRWSTSVRAMLGLDRKPSLDDVAMRDLFDEVAALRQDLAEVHERLDFSERTLATMRQDAINPRSANVTPRVPTPPESTAIL